MTTTSNAKLDVARRRVDAGTARVALMLPALVPVLCLLDLLGARARRVVRSEAGANTVELVVITALVASMAIAVGAVIRNKVTDKANDLDLNTP